MESRRDVQNWIPDDEAIKNTEGRWEQDGLIYLSTEWCV